MKTLTGPLSQITSLLALTVSACAFPLSEESTQSASLPVSAHPRPQHQEGFAPEYDSGSSGSTPQISHPNPAEVEDSGTGALTQNDAENETATPSPGSSQPQNPDSSASSPAEGTRVTRVNLLPNPQVPRANLNPELTVHTLSNGFELQFVPHTSVHVGSGAIESLRVAGIGEFIEDSLCAENQSLVGRDGSSLECKNLDENTSGEWTTGIQTRAQQSNVFEWDGVRSKATASVFKLGTLITGVSLELTRIDPLTEESSVCGLREIAVGIRRTYGKRIVQNRAQRFLKKIEVLCKEAKAVLGPEEDTQSTSLELDLSRERIGPREIQPPVPMTYPTSLNPPLSPRF